MAERESFFARWERVIKTMPLGESWYCDKCQVEVRRRRCPHCGKSEAESA
jgi:ATP sulfurylase